MRKDRRFACLLGTIILFAAGLLGCSGGESEAAAGTKAAKKARTGKAVVAAAKGADEAVERTAQALADGRLEVAWQALPPSYREEVDELVRLAASKMDEEVWNRSFGLVQKLTRLAREKREFFLEQPMLASQGSSKKELEAGWDAVAGILDTLANSPLADLKQLEKLDVGEFLAGTGGEVMEQVAAAASLAPNSDWTDQMSRLRRTEASVVSESGDTATVRIERPGVEPVEQAYTKVEGHWIPEELAKSWPAEMAKFREQIDQISSESMAQNKQSMLMQLSMVEAAVDQLLATESREEFDAALGPIMGMAMGAMMAQASRSSGQPGVPMTAPPTFGTATPQPTMDFPEPSPGPGLPDAQTRDERPIAAAAEAGSHELYEPGEVRFDQAHLYVGQYLRVDTEDGLSMISKLKEVRSDALVFERTLYGGTVTFELTEGEIESLRTEDH
jgi:hypothetical protein